MTCFMCKGRIDNKYTNFIADLGNTFIIIKDVPSQVCCQCGEVSYSNDVALQLEKIVDSLKEQVKEVTITHYTDNPAA